MKENVLITGATGFIGRCLVEHLSMENVNIIAVSRNADAFRSKQQVVCIHKSLSEIEAIVAALKEYEITTCFHLAWEGIPDFSFEKCSRNMEYGLNILEICRKLKIKKLIVSGSCLEYKKVNGFVSEADDLDRDSLFAITKNTLHDFTRVFCRENGMKLYWLRLFYVIGVGQRSGSILPYLIEQYKNGLTPELKTPYEEKDFISVEDVADAFCTVWKENPSGETYNIGTGKLTMVNDLNSLVAKYFNRSNINMHLEGGKSCFAADCTRIMQDTTWKPIEGIEQSVYKMIKASRTC